MSWIHDRMPVILELRDWPIWLGEVDGDVVRLPRPAGQEVLRRWSVSRDLNSPQHDRADLQNAIETPEVRREGEAGPNSI